MSNSATPWTAAHQASLSITNYLSLLKINWKILKEMGIPDHLICLLRNLYAGQKATARQNYLRLIPSGFRKGRGTRDQIANIPWIIEKAREFQKSIYFCFTDYVKAYDGMDHNKL